MSHVFTSGRSQALLIPIVALLTAVVPARGQSGFRFEQPSVSLSLRMGMGGPAGHGEVFDMFTENLTLSPGDFRGAAFAADLGIRVMPRVDMLISLGHDATSNRSWFRDYTEQDGSNIEQTTEFSRTPLTVNVKYYLLPRGRELAAHAWVPEHFTPYFTVGGGYTFYDLKQDGLFVDYQDLEILNGPFMSSGGAATVTVGGGAEYWFTPGFAVTADGRYAWGSTKLESSFDYQKVDLRGFQLTTGIAVRF